MPTRGGNKENYKLPFLHRLNINFKGYNICICLHMSELTFCHKTLPRLLYYQDTCTSAHAHKELHKHKHTHTHTHALAHVICSLYIQIRVVSSAARDQTINCVTLLPANRCGGSGEVQFICSCFRWKKE